MKNFEKVLMDLYYEKLLTNDEEAIIVLDKWLADWLYYKDHCPNCGNIHG